MNIIKKYLIILLLSFSVTFGQNTVRIMTYNLLNYPGSDTTTRNPAFRAIIEYVNPDILVVQELSQPQGIDWFLEKVMNAKSNTYSKGTFIDGPDSDNGIFFKTAKFNFISNTPIKTALRDINEFKLEDKTYNNVFYIYSVHLKSSSGSSNEALRAAEVDSLRKVTNKLPEGTEFIVCGDFNIYKSTEPAYIKLREDNLTDDGNVIDPINMLNPTVWNNSVYAPYHTQSSRGGTFGGLDDRFDMILMSNAMMVDPGIKYISNSTTAVGNDGNHYNLGINESPPNNSAPPEVINALVTASDHLPVYADFIFDVLPVELVYFNGKRVDGNVSLNWKTETETDNYGFEIERAINEKRKWEKIGFVQGSGNSNSPKFYSFTDISPSSDRLFYRLKQIDNDGKFSYSEIIEIGSANKNNSIILNNYPNPFNPKTTIEYELPDKGSAGIVQINIYDILGRLVETLINEEKQPGKYSIDWNAKNLPDGIYLCEVKFSIKGEEQFRTQKKLILLK